MSQPEPEHAPNEPHDVAPQTVPSVARLHAWLSVVSLGTQEPLMQRNVRKVRSSVPPVAHASAKPLHAPQLPAMGAGHIASVVQPTQVPAVPSHVVPLPHGLPT